MLSLFKGMLFPQELLWSGRLHGEAGFDSAFRLPSIKIRGVEEIKRCELNILGSYIIFELVT